MTIQPELFPSHVLQIKIAEGGVATRAVSAPRPWR
jgi:hypothetical protein